jgi:hypothetical protein
MRMYITELSKRKKALEEAIRHAKMYLETAPSGKIRTSRSGWGKAHFYHVTEENGKGGQYLRNEDFAKIRALVQKEYSELLLKEASKELKHINSLISLNKDVPTESIYKKLNNNKIPFIKPYMIDDDICKKMWEKETYSISTYKPEEKIYPTKKGDIVRTKSEVMIADMYYELGIPYRYECELVLNSGKKKHPDFTILDVKRRRVIYHEHFGLFDDEKYRNDNLPKIKEYSKSGIFTGKNLIITFETEKCPININDIRENVKELLL